LRRGEGEMGAVQQGKLQFRRYHFIHLAQVTNIKGQQTGSKEKGWAVGSNNRCAVKETSPNEEEARRKKKSKVPPWKKGTVRPVKGFSFSKPAILLIGREKEILYNVRESRPKNKGDGNTFPEI